MAMDSPKRSVILFRSSEKYMLSSGTRAGAYMLNVLGTNVTSVMQGVTITGDARKFNEGGRTIK